MITGIIRTLPKHYRVNDHWENAIIGLERGILETVCIMLPGVPKKVVLHIYLIIDGKIELRLNIVDYKVLDVVRSFDGSIYRRNFWAICTGPVSRPEKIIEMRGFQGFRYTEALW
jgi:hypothetical protein